MASETTKSHPYHMVNPSPWPIVGTLAAFLMATGGIWYMHEKQPWVLLVGFVLLLFTFFGWWRDVVREANSGVYHTEVVRHGLRVGMLLFIASEVMFFSAWFWTFFKHALYPMGPDSPIVDGVWPPAGIE